MEQPQFGVPQKEETGLDTPQLQEDPIKVKASEFVERWEKPKSEGGENVSSPEETRERAQKAIEYQSGELAFDKEILDRRFAELEQVREQLNTGKNSLIRSIFDFGKIARLEQQLGAREGRFRESEAGAKKREELIEIYNRIIEEQQELSEKETTLAKTGEQSEAARAYLEQTAEIIQRDVSNLMLENNCLFVHAIAYEDEFKPSVNNDVVDTKQFSAMDQVKIVHGIQPTISCSTLRENTTDGIFNSREMGVLVAGGRVLAANVEDMQTKADGLFSRKFDAKAGTAEAIKDALAHGRAVSAEEYAEKGERARTNFDYNEVVVENPASIGVYFSKDYILGQPEPSMFTEAYLMEKFGAKDYDPTADAKLRNALEKNDKWWERVRAMTEASMPVFIINGRNELYHIYNIDIGKRTFEATPKLEAQHLVDGSYRHNSFTVQERRKKMAEEVIDITGDQKKEVA